jgi:hypothetical protein
LLGILEVDIRVPKVWSDRFSHGVMITTVELVDGICRLVETVHGIGSEFLFFTRIEFVLYLTPVTVIEKVHPVKHESVSITLLGMKPVLQASSDEWSVGMG